MLARQPSDGIETPSFFKTGPDKRLLPFNRHLTVTYDPEASDLLGRDYWRVEEAFTLRIGPEQDRTWVEVPAGYLTDGATIPRPLWWLIPPWGKYGQAAVVHDILCENLEVICGGMEVDIQRARADAIFKEAMKASGVTRWKCNVMYIAVRAFAKLQWVPNPQRRAIKRQLQMNWNTQTGDAV